jgi:hypothetical protein
MKRNSSYTKIKRIPESIYLEAETRSKKQMVFERSHRKKMLTMLDALEK